MSKQFHMPEHFDARKLQYFGLDKQDSEKFSLTRLIRAAAFPDDKTATYQAGYELDLCAALQDNDSGEVRGYRIPWAALQRDLTVGTAADGGHLKATEVHGLAPRLDNQLIVEKAGATVLRGLRGDINLPQHNAASTAQWVGESGSPSESSPTFSVQSMTPKTVSGYIDSSRRLLQQNSVDLDAWLGRELMHRINLELDRCALYGDPDTTATANEPRGVLNTTSIGTVSVATNGSAPTRAHLLEMIADCEANNGLSDDSAFILNSAGYNKLASTETASGVGRYVLEGRDFLGYNVHRSQQVPSNLTHGATSNTSAALFGDWKNLLIGIWGEGPQILIDPISLATTGGIRIHAYLDTDVLVRYPAAFSCIASGWVTA